MANPEHVEILTKGPEALRKWWDDHPDRSFEPVGVDLSGADLSEKDLRRADLRRADLRGADLTGTILSGANLTEADLRAAKLTRSNLRGAHLIRSKLSEANFTEADLSMASLDTADLGGAKLSEANLSVSDLSGANLMRADLRKADIRRANLSGADLNAADLSGAKLYLATFNATLVQHATFSGCKCLGTVFADMDLSACIGLEGVIHEAPSTIGIDTIYASGGRIPEAFLRGCGVAESLITMIPSLIGAMKPIEFYSCFISYSHKDEEFSRRLFSRLRDEKLRVWYAPEDMKGGRKIYDQIEQAIRIYDKLLLVLSETSMASEWVKTEIWHARQREAREGKQVLFPIRLVSMDKIREWRAPDADTGKDMAREIREYHIPDFSNWKDHDAFEAGFKKLLEDLKAEGRTGG